MPDIFIYILYAWSGIAIAICVVLLRVRAPYGRYANVGLGPTVANRVGWIVMELPAVLVLPAAVALASTPPSPVTWMMVALWELHYVNRTFVYPFRQRTSGKRMPIVIVLGAIFFNVINGFLNGYYLANFGFHLDASWLTDPRFAIGVIVFSAGLIVNWRADRVLLTLRGPGESDYKIPRGGMFERVSCPNYFGEIVEWIGFAILTWSPAALSFAIWTVANLVPRALSHHAWYMSRFPSYPRTRKAVIPWVV